MYNIIVLQHNKLIDAVISEHLQILMRSTWFKISISKQLWLSI